MKKDDDKVMALELTIAQTKKDIEKTNNMLTEDDCKLTENNHEIAQANKCAIRSASATLALTTLLFFFPNPLVFILIFITLINTVIKINQWSQRSSSNFFFEAEVDSRKDSLEKLIEKDSKLPFALLEAKNPEHDGDNPPSEQDFQKLRALEEELKRKNK